MASSNVLKEFLCKIGFQVDEQKYRNFQEAMRKTAQGALELGKSTAGATTTLGISLRAMASQMESLYYASQRTGASAAHLKEFSFAASQIGVSAEQAQGAIESLAAARRTNPGLNGLLGNFGIDPRQKDNAVVMLQLLTKLRGMPYYQGAQIAQMFGINESTFQMLEQGLPQMQKFLALREKMFAAAAINPQDQVKRSHEFMQDVRSLEAGIGNLADIIAYRLEPAGEKVIHWLEEMVDWLAKADKKTDGWSSKILGVAIAFESWKKASGVLGGILGRGGTTVLKTAGKTGLKTAGEDIVAGGAAEGGAVAAEGAGAVGLGALALPEIIVAAVGAALVWMTMHPEEVRKAAKIAWNATKKGAEAAAHATVKEAHALPGQLKEAAHWTAKQAHSIATGAKESGGLASILQFLPGVLGSLAALTVKAEGERHKLYRDQAGNLTIGIGHLVRKGEDFSKGLDDKGAAALFAKDMSSAVRTVVNSVKVHLSKNQVAALSDLAFNIGSSAFEKSTLLKDLNAGHYELAAAQFAHWNKVLNHGHYVVSEGLTKRRMMDAALFRTPDNAHQQLVVSQKTDIHVTGGDPAATGREVARNQDRVNGDMVRNLSGAVK